MYKVTVNEQPEIKITSENGIYSILDTPVDFDIVANSDGSFHALYQGKSYHIRVTGDQKDHLDLEINGNKTVAKIKNDLEDLLSQMGMDKLGNSSMNELKAPMPGLVLKVFVNPGDVVKKGDSLLVLEAMKMENNIKAVGDGTVVSVQVKPGDKVEKNQVLIGF